MLAKAIEFMIVDALVLADPYLKISDRIFDPKRFVHLTDDILLEVERSETPVIPFLHSGLCMTYVALLFILRNLPLLELSFIVYALEIIISWLTKPFYPGIPWPFGWKILPPKELLRRQNPCSAQILIIPRLLNCWKSFRRIM